MGGWLAGETEISTNTRTQVQGLNLRPLDGRDTNAYWLTRSTYTAPATLFHVNPNEQYADPPSVRPDPLLDGRVLKPPPLPHGKYDKRRGSWLGAPTAFVIKRPAAAALAARIASATAEAPLEIDVVLYHDANRTGSTHRVAAEPQLCYEDEGHSAFDTNIGGGVDTHISEHPGGRKKLR